MSSRRIASVFFPFLSTDRLTRPGAAFAPWAEIPFATVTEAQGGTRIAAANNAAQTLGIMPGLPAADGRALYPALKTIEAEPLQERACLDALADWSNGFSPLAATDGADGLMLDISGCAHLFGGEAAMLAEIAARLEKLGFAHRLGLADTPGAAWAFARFGEHIINIVPEGAGRQFLSGLPVGALRLSAAALEGLRKLGLRRIGDVMSLPRAPVATRFGAEISLRLDQIFGLQSEPISPRRPPSRYRARLAFAEPIGRIEDIAAGIACLLDQLCALLARDHQGARRLVLNLHRVDGGVFRRSIGTAQAIRDPAHLMRLFREGLDTLEAGFGIETMILEAPVVEVQKARQQALTRENTGSALPLLIDRLSQRLGPGNVTRAAPRPGHLPERVSGPAPPLGPLPGAWQSRPRPVRLLPRPEPVSTEMGGTLPPDFTWRRTRHRLARTEGPERIAAEWWHGATPLTPACFRDYWRVEDETGCRFWLFRDGAGQWFLHGLCG